MKFIKFFIILILITNCTKPKSVYICGDHECINKNEAKAYFEENLILEIRILNNKNIDSYDLVELNTKEISPIDKKINIFNKKNKVKKLSKKEIESKKAELLERKKIAKIKQKNIQSKEKELKKISELQKKNKSLFKRKVVEKESNDKINNLKSKKTVYKDDICKIIEKCNIDEIAKYLSNKSDKKDFPDLSKK